MFLTYSKSLPAFYQEMVQLEMDAPSDEKVYVGFHEGFIPLAAKYYEALAVQVTPEPVEAPVVSDPVALVPDPEPAQVVVAPIEADVVVYSPNPVPVLPANPVAVDAPVVKKAKKASV